jgi:hypothetical protein
MTTHVQSAAQAASTITNKIVFNDILATARELGEQSGKGRDTQIKFLLKAVEGGYHQALDLTPNKHGADIDDATALAKAYVEAQQGAVVFDAKAMNQRKLISCLRTSIKLGSWPAGGPGEPLATVNTLMSKRLHYRRVPDTASIVDDAANTLLKFARVQLKRDSVIPEDELDPFCFKPLASEGSLEKVLEGLVSKLDKLIDGEGRIQCDSANVVRARASLRKELARIKGEPGITTTVKAAA